MVSLEVQLQEVMSPLEETPSMIQLDALQFGEVVVLIFGAESIIGGGRREDGSHANGTSHEPVVLAADEIQDGTVEDGHEVLGTGGSEA